MDGINPSTVGNGGGVGSGAGVGSAGKRWQCSLTGVRERLAALHYSANLSNLKLLLADNSTLQVHSLILAMASPVFEAMLTSPLGKTSPKKSGEDEIALVDDPPNAVRALFLVDEVCPETFPSVYSCAQLLEDSILLRRCGEVLATSSKQVLVSRELPGLSRSDLRQLLRHPNLYASSEVDVFKAIVAWGQVNMEGEYSYAQKHPHYTSQQSTEDSSNSRSSSRSRSAYKHLSTPLQATTNTRPIGPTYSSKPVVTISSSHINNPGGSGFSIRPSTFNPSPVVLNEGCWSLGEEEDEDSQTYSGGVEAGHTTLQSHYSPTLRGMVEEFLPYVNFLSMSSRELVLHVFNTSVLSGQEIVGILQTRQGLASPNLPMFISQYHKKRESLLKSTVLLSSSTSIASSLNYFYHAKLTLNVLESFSVSQTVSVVRILSTCVASLQEGTVKVWDCDNVLLNEARWCGSQCTFKRPVVMVDGKRYTITLTCREAWFAALQKQFVVVWKSITFAGQTQCNGKLVVEYLEGN
ncbi:hypothetical protein Pmani_023941 [Petrolisthes manimaculis]|uniref:BTB domain-containing protein n=1 Tax=Petrolisthes manimaculis TaxID=1843537 RepID=A0AAE1PAS7_9EUCA|nr:hypothetical protein Pmani_023941 [Petrolisthes manimaculis]